jgi:hypothetical protein
LNGIPGGYGANACEKQQSSQNQCDRCFHFDLLSVEPTCGLRMGDERDWKQAPVNA